MAKHEHGSMDISEHEKTFAGFLRVASYVTILTFLILAFLALTQT